MIRLEELDAEQPGAEECNLPPIIGCERHRTRLETAIAEESDEVWDLLEDASACSGCQLAFELAALALEAAGGPNVKEPPQQLPIERLGLAEMRVSSGVEYENKLRGGRGWLRPVGSSSMELAGMFLPYQTQAGNQLRATCLVARWNLIENLEQFDSLPVEEMAFLLETGEVDWQFDGMSEPVRLSAHHGSRSLLWAAAPSDRRPGLPPFQARVRSSRASGIAFFYSPYGVPFHVADHHDRIELHQVPWTAPQVDEYWRSIGQVFPSMRGRSPFVTQIPLRAKDLERHISRNPSKDAESGPHVLGYKHGQFRDAYLPAWQELRESRIDRPAPKMDFQLFGFPPAGKRADSSLDLASHTGYETMVVLAGELDCATGQEGPKMAFGAQSATFDQLVGARFLPAAMRSRQVHSDLVMFFSGVYHGFVTRGHTEAYVLLVRFSHYQQELPKLDSAGGGSNKLVACGGGKPK